jgi:hypothetical protein
MSSLWPLGITIYISGTVGEALGANLQRKSLTNDADRILNDPSYQHRGKFRQKLWVTGFILFVCAGIFMSFALFFASQTVLAPLQLFLFLSNVVFASLINNETFIWLGWDGAAMLCVIFGVTMSVVSAPKHTADYTSEEMLWLMRQSGFIAFCCFAGFFLIFMTLVKRRILISCHRDPRTIQRRWVRTLLNMSYGSIAGAFGGVNVTLTKSVFSLMVGQFNDGGFLGVISSPVLWVTGIVLIGTYVMQIVNTVSGLEVTSAIIVISAHSVTEEVVAASGGILYFQDYLNFHTWAWPVFVLGNMLAIFSVIGLSHLRLHDLEEKEHHLMMQLISISRNRSTSDGYLICHRTDPERSDSCIAYIGLRLPVVNEEDLENGEAHLHSPRRRISTW